MGRCAQELRTVQSYPVVNTAAASGLRAISLSEILALRSDLCSALGLPPGTSHGPSSLAPCFRL